MIENPNYTQVPNIILDSLGTLKPACLKVILAITRETLGWHERSKMMSITYLMEMTGLSNRAVINAGAELSELGWVERRKVSHKNGEVYEYGLLLEPVKKVHPCKKFTSEKSSRATSEKSSQGVVKKVHTYKERSKERRKEKESDFAFPDKTPLGEGESVDKTHSPLLPSPSCDETPKNSSTEKKYNGWGDRSDSQRANDRFNGISDPCTPWRDARGQFVEGFIVYVGALMYSKLGAIAQRNKAITALKFADPRKNKEQNGEMLGYWKSYQMEANPNATQAKGLDLGVTADNSFWETPAGQSFKKRAIEKSLNIQVKAVRMNRVVCVVDGEDKIYTLKGAA